MAKMNFEGSVTAGCTRCAGTVSTFEWRSRVGPYGVLSEKYETREYRTWRREFRLFRCAGCGRGGLGVIDMPDDHDFPNEWANLLHFAPDVRPAAPLPTYTPKGIVSEFREGESCLEATCYRAAAAMFRSALEKTLSASGYKPDAHTSLYKQIESAAADGSITDARKRRAHDEIRVLGNDVLHDDWKEVSDEDAILARDYTQRVIEDLYDHRPSTLARLREKGRVPAEDQAPAT
jgi:hypothetical protein